MTYREFLEKFIRTDKTYLEYQRNEAFYRIIKIQVAQNVYVLFAHLTYGCSNMSHRFNAKEDFELVGYVDHNGNVRFPEYELAYRILDETEGLDLRETAKQRVENAIYDEVVKLATLQPLPDDPNERGVYQAACNLLFREQEKMPAPYLDFYDCVTNDTIIDYLADTPNWARNIALEWAAKTDHYDGGIKQTNLDTFRSQLSRNKKIEEAAKQLLNDPTDAIHQYIAMKRAVSDYKNVTVRFKTRTGSVDETKMPAEVFRQEGSDALAFICLYRIAPTKECERVQNLAPLRHGYPSSILAKTDVVGIYYRGKELWPKKNTML